MQVYSVYPITPETHQVHYYATVASEQPLHAVHAMVPPFPLSFSDGVSTNMMSAYDKELHYSPQSEDMDPLVRDVLLYDPVSDPSFPDASQISGTDPLATQAHFTDAFAPQPPLSMVHLPQYNPTPSVMHDPKTPLDNYTQHLEQQLQEKILLEEQYQLRIQSLMELVSRQSSKIGELRSELNATRAARHAYTSSVSST